MKRFGVIYLITNKLDGKQYVGQTKNSASSRFNDHCRDKRSSRYLSSSIQKYGRNNFILTELISCFDEKSLNDYETFFIKLFNTLNPNGYNLSMGGHIRGEISEKTRLQMSLKKLGKKVKRTKKWSDFSRINKSKAQGGRPIVAENIKTGELKFYNFIAETEKDGFHNATIYKVLKGKQKQTRGYKFYYLEYYANQNLIEESNKSSAVQRIEGEPVEIQNNSPRDTNS